MKAATLAVARAAAFVFAGDRDRHVLLVDPVSVTGGQVTESHAPLRR